MTHFLDSSSSETGTDCRRWISSLSHEIRNPLTLIYSSLQILEKEYPCVSDSPLWEQTKSDIQFLIRLLKDSSAAAKDYQPRWTDFPVQELFQELALSARSLLDEHDIELITPVWQSAAGKGPILRADRARLKEALTNLLINAVDALSSMPKAHHRQIVLTANVVSGSADDLSGFASGISGSADDISGSASGISGSADGISGSANGIFGSADGTGDVICLHVRDNGPGIPDDYLDTIFDPFVTHKSDGTGLGLSIVRNIVRLHGGTVFVETDTASGRSFTDFCLCIPAFIP